MKRIDHLIGKLKQTRQDLQRLKTHQHEWGSNDYCMICLNDGRA